MNIFEGNYIIEPLNFFCKRRKRRWNFSRDCGIFITNIAKYQKNEQLDIGDRLLQISSAVKWQCFIYLITKRFFLSSNISAWNLWFTICYT